jgi:hypothetical protein
MPPIVEAPRDASLVRAAGRLGPWPAELSGAIAALPAEAPAEESFRAWLLRHVDVKTAEAIIGVVFIPTFDHDPGRLSAAFARQRLRRALAGGARYVAGGWSTLVGLLAERAASLGAQIRTQTRVASLPAGPTILAPGLATARHLVDVLLGQRAGVPHLASGVVGPERPFPPGQQQLGQVRQAEEAEVPAVWPSPSASEPEPHPPSRRRQWPVQPQLPTVLEYEVPDAGGRSAELVPRAGLEGREATRWLCWLGGSP